MNVAPKNPIGRLADTAINTLKNPLETAGKVVEQTKGTAAFGKMVVEQVGRSAVTKATETAGAVVGKARARNPESDTAEAETATPLRPVTDVNEPAHTTGPLAERAEESTKQHGDPVRKPAEQAAKKATAKKSAVKKATGKKTAARPTPIPSPKDVAEVVEAAVAEDPRKTAAKPATKAASGGPAKKTAPGDKLPTKKTAKPAKKSTPRTAEQLASGEGEGVATPAGTSGAAPGNNPDTAESDLNQPGTEGILEESTAKAVASKSARMRKAAERNPE
ncbi:MAG TPA: hypothetical protein VJ819_07255 [Nocardioidaceae bacterium]|jgi:hypothetical protein|nr:hypothetical protein [Nocardioidaceae bacterium]